MEYTDIHLQIPRPDFRLRWRHLVRWIPTPGNVIFTLLMVGGLL